MLLNPNGKSKVLFRYVDFLGFLLGKTISNDLCLEFKSEKDMNYLVNLASGEMDSKSGSNHNLKTNQDLTFRRDEKWFFETTKNISSLIPHICNLMSHSHEIVRYSVTNLCFQILKFCYNSISSSCYCILIDLILYALMDTSTKISGFCSAEISLLCKDISTLYLFLK